jgi:hypothetical protein
MADLAAVIAGLSMLGNDGNAVAAQLAAQLARAYRNICGYLYDQYMADKSADYVNLKTIGDVTDYRYIHYDSKDETTMSGKGSSLSFKNNSNIVRNAYEQRQTLSGRAHKQKVLYIREEDSILYFTCEGEPIPKTQLEVCMTPYVKKRALELVEYFTQAQA